MQDYVKLKYVNHIYICITKAFFYQAILKDMGFHGWVAWKKLAPQSLISRIKFYSLFIKIFWGVSLLQYFSYGWTVGVLATGKTSMVSIREAFHNNNLVKSGNFEDCLTLPPPSPVCLEKLTSNFYRFAEENPLP